MSRATVLAVFSLVVLVVSLWKLAFVYVLSPGVDSFGYQLFEIKVRSDELRSFAGG
jgi:hypothetical protein